MTLSSNMKAAVVSVSVLVILSLTACGGSGASIDEGSSPSAPTMAPNPTVATQPTASSKPTPVSPATAVPQTPVPTATPEPPLAVDKFGFYLGLDRGAYVTNLPGNTDEQGILQLEYSGVNVILSWVPINGVTNESLIAGMFEMLQNNQPNLTLETVSESSLSVGLESGLVVGFKSADGSGNVTGGGLIGAWNCLDEETSFTITVTGQDASLVQLRFNRLINNFECS